MRGVVSCGSRSQKSNQAALPEDGCVGSEERGAGRGARSEAARCPERIRLLCAMIVLIRMAA